MFARIHHHKIEIAGGVILLLLSALLPQIGVSTDVAWLAGIMSVLLSLAVAVIKDHFSSLAREITSQTNEGPGKAAEIARILSELDGIKFQFATSIVDDALRKTRLIQHGEIPLDTATYFHQIIECMNASPRHAEVLAVNCIDELRWNNDPREVTYLAANHAARERGVNIHRLFVLNRELITGDNTEQRLEIVTEQVEAENITTTVVWQNDLIDQVDRIKDWVYFAKPTPKLFVDFADPVDKTRVSHARLIVDEEWIRQFHEDFRILRESAISDQEFLGFVREHTSR
jgi:hypothetical protein